MTQTSISVTPLFRDRMPLISARQAVAEPYRDYTTTTVPYYYTTVAVLVAFHARSIFVYFRFLGTTSVSCLEHTWPTCFRSVNVDRRIYMQGRERPNPTRTCMQGPLARWIVTQPASFFLAPIDLPVPSWKPFHSIDPTAHGCMCFLGTERYIDTQSCASRDTWTSLSPDRQTGRHFIKPLYSFYDTETWCTCLVMWRLLASWPYYWSLFSCLRSERTTRNSRIFTPF
jgi:hypothetical protein